MSTATEKRTLLLAQLPTGTAANDVLQLDGSAKVPAVDGSQLTNMPFAPSNLPINAQTGTTYTLVLSDNNSIVSISNSSAQTVTIPPNSDVAFPVGAQVFIEQAGAGAATIAEGAGVTVNAIGGGLVIGAQYAVVSAIKVATNVWLLSGVPLNLGAPGPIGYITPSTGKFTNTEVSGTLSLTSASTVVINTTATNVLEFQFSGTSTFDVANDGSFQLRPTAAFYGFNGPSAAAATPRFRLPDSAYIGNPATKTASFGYFNGTMYVDSVTFSDLAIISTIPLTIPGGSTPVLTTSSDITSGAASGAGTLTNAPASGNPTTWIPIKDNGTTRYIPAW